jgi:demethylmenaquinone methyltransferase/2-methoxy-6-polyprenyl-1,4-benzoquinol methylase
MKQVSGNEGKKDSVRNMFDTIAYRYDFLNHFLSLGIDHYWRNRVLRLAKYYQPSHILDVATGTADLAIVLSKCKPQEIIGIDISEGMLEIGRHKINHKGLETIIKLQHGDSEELPFPEASFDMVSAAFGVRNFEDLKRGLGEMCRVLKKGGHVVILEFSTIENPVWKFIFKMYFRGVLPLIGRLVSNHDFAYHYLPQSVSNFPYSHEFLSILQGVGFENTRQIRLSGGVATIYTGERK